MGKILKKIYKSTYFHLIVCAGLATIAALLLLPFVQSERQSGHDIKYHLGVIRSLSAAWENGNFFGKTMELIGGDYGYGTGIFYSTVPASICVVFMKGFHMPVIGALYLEILLLFIGAAITVYFFLYRVFHEKILALIGGAIYLIYPYFLWDVYVRFAYTEIVLMLAIPLIVWGVFELLYRQNSRAFLPLFIIGYVLAILSHLTMTLYLTLFIVLWLLMEYKRTFKKKNLFCFGIAAIVVLLITASYSLPMLINYGVTATDTMSKTPEQMYVNTKKYFTEEILMWDYKFVLAVAFSYAAWYWFFAKGKRTVGKRVVLVESLLVVLLFTHYFPWDKMPNALRMIQYTFRVLLLGGVLTSLQACILIKEIFFALPQTYRETKQSYLSIKNQEKLKDVDVSSGTSKLMNFLRRQIRFIKKNLFKWIPCVGLCVGIAFCSAMAVPHNQEMFAAYDNAAQHADVAIDELTGRSEFYGLGAGKHGDYFPLQCRWEYVSTRLQDDLIAKSNMNVSEIANYRALKQVSFVVKNSQEPLYAVLNVPYAVFEGVEVYRFRTSTSNRTLDIKAKSYNDGNQVYLDTLQDGNESKIILSYKNAPLFEEYLAKTAFGVLTLEGDVAATNLRKEHAGKYSLEVTAGENGGILELPSYYYKGYTLTLQRVDGSKIVLADRHGRNGFLEVEIQESGTLYVEFSAPYLTVAKALSWTGVVLFVGALGWVIFYKEKRGDTQAGKNETK